MRLVEKIQCPGCRSVVMGQVSFSAGSDPVPEEVTCPDCHHRWVPEHQIGLGRGHLGDG